MKFNASRFAPWMIASMMLSGVAIWLAARVAFRQADGAAANEALGPPLKPTRVAERVLRDPAEAYASRAAKGMTAGQLRWIAEDFRNRGLDAPADDLVPPEELARRQKLWYLEALSLGLSLTAEQKEQARWRLFAHVRSQNETGLFNFPQAPDWLTVGATEPWKLCQLTENQLALTTYDRQQTQEFVGRPTGEEPAQEVPDSDLRRDLALLRTQPDFFLKLLPVQKSPEGTAAGSLAQLRALHPAQFQLLLLLAGMPAEVSAALDEPGEPEK